jgi:GNAT superfamily N-acetyltransferase
MHEAGIPGSVSWKPAHRMKHKTLMAWRRHGRRLARRLFAALPAALRFGLYRRAMNFAPARASTLELKIADSQAELEQCFALLHDAYVASGFMRPHPSGLRVTPYHALPTTTTLCAKVDGQVVGTLSIVREGVFGFPMQTAFDISSVRAKQGRIAEISALAVHPRYRKTGGSVLFPLMKFMYEYCTRYFDTRHLLIAVNPGHIEMYESLLFFQRLQAQAVDRYDFVNGAPAVGATLDLHEAPAIFERAYGHKPGHRNLHHYFCHTALPAIRFPPRPWHLSNDPVLTPALMDHFFNQRTQGFDDLDERKRRLLHALYPGAAWARVLPPMPKGTLEGDHDGLRAHQRFSLKCPASMNASGLHSRLLATIIEISRTGFLARLLRPLQVGMRCEVLAELGDGVRARVQAHVVREVNSQAGQFYGFQVDRSDDAWQRCVAWLESADQSPALAAGAALLRLPEHRQDKLQPA